MTTLPLSDILRKKWSISMAHLLADTPSSTLYRVTLTSRERRVVKLIKPAGVGELPGMDFLAWRAGLGAITLFERHENACLLEDAGEIILADYRARHGEKASNDIIVGIVAALHAQSPLAPPARFTPLISHFAALFAEASVCAAPHAEDLKIAARYAEKLLQDQTNIRPLHGDLHHNNIISGGPRGWLAIDPQGLIGDPAYDVANVFGNPNGAIDDILNPVRITALVDLFSGILECDREKVLGYAIAHAGLSVCWSLEGGKAVDDSENARERLAFIRAASPLLYNIKNAPRP